MKVHFELARFLIIGALNTVLSYAIFMAVYAASDGKYIVALLASYSLTIVTGFFLHKIFTFRSTKNGQFLYYLLLNMILISINYFLLDYIINKIGILKIWITQALLLIAISCFSFIFQKLIIFTRTK